jgi:hypothetical protein
VLRIAKWCPAVALNFCEALNVEPKQKVLSLLARLKRNIRCRRPTVAVTEELSAEATAVS